MIIQKVLGVFASSLGIHLIVITLNFNFLNFGTIGITKFLILDSMYKRSGKK